METKEYTMDDFRINDYMENTIVENGDRDSINGCWNINTSTILTKLIFVAGRFTEWFASDLFIWWNTIDKKLDNGTMETESFLFGFYDSGVNSAKDVIRKYTNNNVDYRAIYRLDFEVNGNDIKATLGRVSI